MKSYSRVILASLLLMLFLLAGCPATQVVFPPVPSGGADVQTPGKFVWFDLFSTEMAECETFYASLFGWDFQLAENSKGRVKTISLQGTPIGNLIGRESTKYDSQWLSYMSTENVDATMEAATQNGGSIFRESGNLPDRGRVGVVLDPQGAAFAVLTSPDGDPLDAKLKPNMWMGAELWTTNVKEAAKFYQRIAGYDVQIVDVHGDVKYLMLKKDDRFRGGIVHIPWKTMKPEWVPYIAVDDVSAIVDKAKALGGKVLIAPDLSDKEGRLAMIADPSGAIFSIYQIR